MDASISVERIEEAASVIDAVFLHSPQFFSEPLSKRLRVRTALKVETVNPIRSFKGRGAAYLLHRLRGELDDRPIVCATAGNFGQGMAYACRENDRRLTVYAPHTANPLKLERMKALGVKLELEVGDFDQAKDAARRHAEATGELFIEDGLVGAIGEGAGTMARELTEGFTPLDAIFVPLGNGSLVNGVGTWFKHRSPRTKVIAVCAAAAPSMALSFAARRSITAPSASIADGIAVRVPVPEAVATMLDVVDDVMLVSDDEMLAAMRALHGDAGLVVEPAGAAGVAAIARTAERFEGMHVAAIVTGGNLTEQQLRDWLY
ncbi:MAG TPA: pyridoxal-phosphate dependent enzyme [Candidatus Dormibacteraeota bacterium]|nr:pyridoxal-phosphate dependent enzyme [Candidatus Dormibacteraeota bacterium]